jgi:hypothetical protein
MIRLAQDVLGFKGRLRVEKRKEEKDNFPRTMPFPDMPIMPVWPIGLVRHTGIHSNNVVSRK